MTKHLFFVLGLMLVIGVSCKKEDTTPQVNPEEIFGKAGFRYIAVGNSITAGYSNGGLYLEGQKVAYPVIIAEQLKKYNVGSFTVPFFSTEQENGSGYLKLVGINPDGTPNIVPVTDKLAVRDSINIPGFGNVTLYTKYTGNIENYGVPGLKLKHVSYNLYGNLNGFYERLLPGNAGTNITTYLDFVTSKPFDFFSCWLGNNDALGYASEGGEGEELTDKAEFQQLYNTAITALTKDSALGVVATIPNLTALPYFTTITVSQLVTAATKVNPAFNKIYIQALDANGNHTTRVANDKDLILLTFKTSDLGAEVNSLPGYGLTSQNPLLSKVVLDSAEVAKVQDYIDFYNKQIKAIGTAKNLAVFDSYDFLTKLKDGMTVNGESIDSKFITGKIFSLDGVHLTPKGNALTADQFIKAINDKYHTDIPLVDITKYKGVL